MTIVLDRTTRNLAIGFLLGGLLLGGLAWMASPSDRVNGARPPSTPTVLTSDPATHNFGTISMANGVVRKTFTITNPSSDLVTISKIKTSCMCTEATITAPSGTRYGPFGMEGHGFIPPIDVPLAPGASTMVEVAFDPTAHGPAGVGRIDRTVFIENSAGRPLSLNFTVMVTP